jgi:hypothetical protein
MAQREQSQQRDIDQQQCADDDDPERKASARLRDPHLEQGRAGLSLALRFGLLQRIENEGHQLPRVA